MPVVERPTVFGIELPFLDKGITPDLKGLNLLVQKYAGKNEGLR